MFHYVCGEEKKQIGHCSLVMFIRIHMALVMSVVIVKAKGNCILPDAGL